MLGWGGFKEDPPQELQVIHSSDGDQGCGGAKMETRGVGVQRSQAS